jgi:hypothetical protein
LAVKPVDNETFYREVDEELRRDQLAGQWKRYGKLIVAGVVLFLAAIGGAIWWQNQRTLKAGERGESLTSAFEDIAAGNKKAADPKLDALIKDGPAGYKAAALLTRADLAAESSDMKGAVANFRAVADNQDFPKPYRDLALVRVTAVEFDRLPPQAVLDRLKPLATPDNAFFGSAGEMVAIAYLKLNRPAEAGRLYAAMAKDKKVPDSIRSRSQQMASSLGFDAIQQPLPGAPQAGASQEGRQ